MPKDKVAAMIIKRLDDELQAEPLDDEFDDDTGKPTRFEWLQDGAGNDVWGLDRTLRVHVGYDSRAERADPGPPPEPEINDYQPITKAEKLRLADMMIERWKRYRVAVLEQG